MIIQLELNKNSRNEHTELDKEKPLPQHSLQKTLHKELQATE